MSLRDIVSVLASKRIWLWNDNGQLRFSAPKGIMDADTRSLIGEFREELLELVRKFTPNRCLVAPATLNQSSLIFIQKIAPQSAAYNVAVSFSLCSRVVRSAFESACHILCQHHTQLKVSFLTAYDNQTGENIVCQVIKDCNSVNIQFKTEQINDKDELQATVINDYKQPFNLENGPLIRWSVFNAESESPVVLMVIHHSIVDAWSVKILVKEFFNLYNKALNESNSVDQCACIPTFGYIDYALLQQEQLSNEYFKEHYKYFKSTLTDHINPIELITDYKRPEINELTGDSIPFVISSDVYKKISLLAQTYGITINTILLTAYMLMLYNETKQSRFAVGMPVSNRDNPKFIDAVGYFVNTIALPFSLDKVSKYDELLKRVHETTIESVKYQGLPFSSVVNFLNPPRDSSRSPVFQVLFNFLSRSLLGPITDLVYENTSEKYLTIEGVEVKPFSIPQEEGQFDLTLEMVERNGYVSGQLKYSTAIFTKERMIQLLQQYHKTLEIITENPSSPVIKHTKSEKGKIVITATFTADTLDKSLEFWIDRLKLNITYEFTSYGQITLQLLNPESPIRHNSGGYNVILLRMDDLLYKGANNEVQSAVENIYEYLSERCNEILEAVSIAMSNQHATFLIIFCPSDPSFTSDPERAACMDKIQKRYTKLFNELPGVHAIDTESIFTWYPYHDYHDPIRLENGHIPYTQDFFTILATVIARRIFIINQKPIKVILADCDNTLWKGIAAEDGPDGIVVSQEHQQFQTLLINQRTTGRLIALVSKNREADIDTVFEKESMILKKDYIYSKRINWDLKSNNIRSIANEINVGLDGLLFIDDNEIECAEVSSVLPQVVVSRFPASISDIPDYLSSLWMLDNIKTTEEDKKRYEYYQSEKHRNAIRTQTSSFNEFISKLELVVSFSPMDEKNGERLSQLSYRTNQFNLSDKKFNYVDLVYLKDAGYNITAVSVKDRFGDYGIVGMIISKNEGNIVHIETFLLSCRVLSRGVEYSMVKHLTNLNCETLHFHAVSTGRNQPGLNFLEKIEKQCSKSKRQGIDLIITAAEGSNFSYLPDEFSKEISKEPEMKPKGDCTDILTRNSIYRDISENLYSVEKIIAAVDEYSKRSEKINIGVQINNSSCSQMEKEIISIWENALGKMVHGIDVNFFDAGGKSLQLPQILVQLNEKFGVDLMLVDLFKYPTIAMISKCISEITNKVSSKELIDNSNVKKMLSGMSSLRQRHQQLRKN